MFVSLDICIQLNSNITSNQRYNDFSLVFEILLSYSTHLFHAVCILVLMCMLKYVFRPSVVAARSWNTIEIWTERIAWERTGSLLKGIICALVLLPSVWQEPSGWKGKAVKKRDIGSRHGEVFVSILSIPSLSRNPNFHHSPTYWQIKAGWRGISSIETACNLSA